jgi:hypothetical protein
MDGGWLSVYLVSFLSKILGEEIRESRQMLQFFFVASRDHRFVRPPVSSTKMQESKTQAES